MQEKEPDLESKLLIDDFVAEIKEKFYLCRITYLKHRLYTSIKTLSPEKQKYLIEKFYADKFLIENFSDIILEFTYLQPSAIGMEDKLNKTKIIQDETGSYRTLKFWDYMR